MASAVLTLLEDPALWSESSREARGLVERFFDWGRSMESFEQIVLEPSRIATPIG